MTERAGPQRPAVWFCRFPGFKVVHLVLGAHCLTTRCGVDFPGQPTIQCQGPATCRNCRERLR